MNEFEQDPIELPEPAPSDVVPILRRPGDRRQALLALNAAVGKPVPTYTPAEVVSDMHGYPAGVGEADLRHRQLAGGLFLLSEIHAAGLRREDVPNLKVIDREGNLL